jgi:lysophospholipase L1-like esterase
MLLLLGLETATKMLGIHFPALIRHRSAQHLWVFDRTKGWFHQPNGTGSVPLSGPDRALVRINSLGLRGKEISRQKPEGTKRIVVFGDSFVFGLGVDEEHIFTTHLESFLNARSPDVQYEVVNMGVTGYSTDQEYILLQELGMRLFPDVVILVSCDNDFLANTQNFVYKRYYKPFYELDEEGRLSLRNSPVPFLSRAQRVKLFLGQESNVWNFVRHRTSDRIGPFLDLFQVDVPRTSSIPQVDITAALIAAFAERVDTAGARFLSINTAHRGEMTPLFHALRPKLEKLGINQLGLEEFLGNARRDAPNMYWDFSEDTHWNRDAHRLAAEIIAGHLFRHGLLP